MQALFADCDAIDLEIGSSEVVSRELLHPRWLKCNSCDPMPLPPGMINWSTLSPVTNPVVRFRNDALLATLEDPTGSASSCVSDAELCRVFGSFAGVSFPALKYDGVQFGVYNKHLGDGRSLLIAKLFDAGGRSCELSCKGGGRTAYSRSADGKLTLLGGLKEVLVGEALHMLRIPCSRVLCILEPDEKLHRPDDDQCDAKRAQQASGDAEESVAGTRSCLAIRLMPTHLRVGSLQALHRLGHEGEIFATLCRVIHAHFPEVAVTQSPSKTLVAWFHAFAGQLGRTIGACISLNLCHGVLNSDNLLLTGAHLFDFGTFDFSPTLNPSFVAAKFDKHGRYSLGDQQSACREQVEGLIPLLLAAIAAAGGRDDPQDMLLQEALPVYDSALEEELNCRILLQLGIDLPVVLGEISSTKVGERSGKAETMMPSGPHQQKQQQQKKQQQQQQQHQYQQHQHELFELVTLTRDMLRRSQIDVLEFFEELAAGCHPNWFDGDDDGSNILQPWTSNSIDSSSGSSTIIRIGSASLLPTLCPPPLPAPPPSPLSLRVVSIDPGIVHTAGFEAELAGVIECFVPQHFERWKRAYCSGLRLAQTAEMAQSGISNGAGAGEGPLAACRVIRDRIASSCARCRAARNCIAASTEASQMWRSVKDDENWSVFHTLLRRLDEVGQWDGRLIVAKRSVDRTQTRP